MTVTTARRALPTVQRSLLAEARRELLLWRCLTFALIAIAVAVLALR